METGDYDTFTRMYGKLPKTTDGYEKMNSFSPTTYFEFDSDHKPVKSRDSIIIPLLTKKITEDYALFSDLLKDKNKKPIVVFKKDFLKKIEQIYE